MFGMVTGVSLSLWAPSALRLIWKESAAILDVLQVRRIKFLTN